jgi:hypothetical protein
VYSSPIVPIKIPDEKENTRIGEILVNNFPPLRMFRQSESNCMLTTEVDVNFASVVTVSEIEVLVVVIVAES